MSQLRTIRKRQRGIDLECDRRAHAGLEGGRQFLPRLFYQRCDREVSAGGKPRGWQARQREEKLSLRAVSHFGISFWTDKQFIPEMAPRSA